MNNPESFILQLRCKVLILALVGMFIGHSMALGQNGQGALSDGLRLENELKIPIPDELTEEVWEYIQTRYDDDVELWGSQLGTQVSVELFIDTYYDTPRGTMLEQQNGIRHRWRKFPNGDVKELIQIKITRETGNSTRGELKFGVRNDDRQPRDAMDNHILMRMMDKSDRLDFVNALESLGVQLSDLRQSLVLTQNRHRVYIREMESSKSLATLTLDHMDGKIGWLAHQGVELELELNEINYTTASESERRRMEDFNEAILADLLERFPALSVDLTPKYNKSHALLKSRHPVQYLIIRHSNALFLVLLVLVMLPAGVLLIRFQRRSRSRKAAVV